jgi:hypothetical protein
MISRRLITSVLMLAAVPGIVHASPLLVLEKQQGSETSSIDAKFEVNRELGRAWIEIQIIDSGISEAASIVELIRKPVEGLTFDNTTKTVVYTRGEHSVVCANEKALLFSKSYAPTAECPIVISFENQMLDDGFNVSNEVVWKVVFDPKA